MSVSTHHIRIRHFLQRSQRIHDPNSKIRQCYHQSVHDKNDTREQNYDHPPPNGITDTPNAKIAVKKRQMDVFTSTESISTAKEHTPLRLRLVSIYLC